MLWDPKWANQTYDLSVGGLISWLERQPPEKTYDWHDCRGWCLIAQFVKDTTEGRQRGWQYAYVRGFTHKERSLIASQEPFTFGAALERARALR